MALLEAPAHRWIILHALFSPRIAGAERYCVDLANHQAALGHRVHVAGQPGSPMQGALAANVTFHALASPLLRGFRMRRLMDRFNVDLCHAHLSPACKAVSRVPASVTSVATLHVGYKPHQHARFNGVICVNRAQSSRLNSYRGAARIIPNWLPSTETTSATANVNANANLSSVRLRAELGLEPRQLLIGAVGRLHPSKGVDVLISAFKAIAPRDAALVIVGEGPQRAALERLADGDTRIHFTGFRSDVPRLLPELDLFVSPSREESFGLSILEAMRAGLPIISSATEGPREVFGTQPIAWVAPASVPEMAAALKRMLSSLSDQREPRVDYDLSLFEASRAVTTVMDFYLQSARQRQDSAFGLKPRLDVRDALIV